MALRIEATIEDLLKPEPKTGRAAKTPAPDIHQRFTPGTPGYDFMRTLTTPARTPDEEEVLEFDVAEDTFNQRNARLIKKILERHALPKWKELILAESKTERVRKPGLERFEPGKNLFPNGIC
jgi:hypothetical protein